MEKQDQHYVPKVYLKEFSKHKSGHFYAAGPKPNFLKTINPRHVKQVCYLYNFYTLNERIKTHAGLDNVLFLEKRAFEYENRLLPRIISKLKHRNVYLNKSYHDSLVDIYLNLKQRNLFYRNNFRGYDLSKVTDEEIEKMKSVKSWIEDMSGEKYERIMGRIKEQIINDKELPDELHKYSLIKTAKGKNQAINNVSEKLKRMEFYILEPLNRSDYFVTSDNPGFTLLGYKIYNTHFGHFDSIGFPINSTQAIFLIGQSRQNQFEIHKKINFVKVPSKGVDLVNFCTIFNSNEYVFCESKKYLTDLIDRFEIEYGVR